MKDDSGNEKSESNDSSKESGEEDEDEGREIEGDEIEIEGEEVEDEDEGEETEDEGEDDIEDEGVKMVENAVDPTITASIGFVGLVGPAGPVGSAPAPTIGSSGGVKSLVPAIAILPPTPIKNKGKSKVTPDDNREDMLQVNHDYPPDLDPDSLMVIMISFNIN